MNVTAKKIKPINLLDIYTHESWVAKPLLTLLHFFTTFHIKKIGTELNGYDYLVLGYLRPWFFVLTYPCQLAIMLATCIWDGGLRECYLPSYRHFYYDHFEWIDEESLYPVKAEWYKNAKELWERA